MRRGHRSSAEGEHLAVFGLCYIVETKQVQHAVRGEERDLGGERPAATACLAFGLRGAHDDVAEATGAVRIGPQAPGRVGPAHAAR